MQFFYNIGMWAINLFSSIKMEAMKFEPYQFVENLGYMLKGMIGIFVVIGIIILLTAILNKTANKLSK